MSKGRPDALLARTMILLLAAASVHRRRGEGGVYGISVNQYR